MKTIETHNPDEIDIRELLTTLKKRQKMILLVTLLSVLLAVAYVSVAKPVYQVQAMIELGKINAGRKNEITLDNLNDVKQKLEYLYGVHSKKKRVYPKVKAITISKNSKGILSVIVEGHSNEGATTLLNKIVKKIETQYAAKVKSYSDTQKELIQLTKTDIETTTHNLGQVSKTLENYQDKIMHISAADAALAGIYTIQISQNQTQAQALQSRISALKSKVYDLELTITPLRIKKTHIIGSVEILDAPIKPKKVLIVIVALITGLMFSVFLAFFLEFLGESNRDLDAKV